MNKRDIICITAYVNNEERKNLLKECITACRKFGMDILVASHSVLTEDIIKMVDYYVYDADNRFNNGGHIILWKQFPNMKINILSKHSHEYPIIKLIRNMLYTAKANGYTFFYGLDFDNILSEQDVVKLLELKVQAEREDKDFIFFYPPDASWELDGELIRGIYYDIYVLGGNLDKYLKIFDAYFPTTIEDFNQTMAFVTKGKPQCLEHYHFDAFKNHKSRSLIINSYVHEYLSTSRINVSVLDKPPVITILPTNTNKYYLYIANDTPTNQTFIITMYGKSTQYILNGTHIENSYVLIELESDCDIQVEHHQLYAGVKIHDLQFRKNNNDYSRNGIIEMYNV